YHIPPILIKEQSPKTSGKIYKIRRQYYTNNRYGVVGRKIEKKWVDVYVNGKQEKEKIAVPADMKLEEFVDSLERRIDIDSIAFIGIFEIISDDIESIQSDKFFYGQWGLHRIYIQDAWDITMGDSTLIVAVLEEDGIDWSHFELGKGHDNYQNIYVNSVEDTWTNLTDSNGRKTYNPQSGNGLDDDEDGFIDNFIGWNFKDNNNDCRTDSCSHGTAVAGIIAAKTNNGRGISGIAGGDSCAGVKILPYAMRRHFGLCLQDATKKNARMANMSFSLGQPNDSLLIIYNSNIQNAFNHGVLMIAASGNLQYPINNVKYPARNPYVMAVGAINKKNERRPTSCYGSELSVVAPGDSIVSLSHNHGFSLNGGTSSAAPHVTGVAALMLSVNPNLTPADVRRIIEKTARKVGGYNYHNDPQHPNGTWNEEMGYGLVDAHAAVLNVVDSTLDLYVRDSENDNGDEPSVTTTPWNSPDIWIEDMNHREVTSLQGLTNYYVCVRIHNRTGHASTGYEKLYLNWVKAGPGSDWSAAWQGEKKLTGNGGSISLGYPIIGGNSRKGHAIPVISAGRDTVVRVRWKVPEPTIYSDYYSDGELNHFCLCARIHDGRRIENEDSDGI
ncbi:MAG: S8 family serine peptidase, partial [Bacteroidales bacterium]|nr:S8 family serine peptidase [Bacteroidales bacterium]